MDTIVLYLNKTYIGIITINKAMYAIIINNDNIVNNTVDMLLRKIKNPATTIVTPNIPRIITNVAMINSIYVNPTDFSVSVIFERLNPSLNESDSTIQMLAICEI